MRTIGAATSSGCSTPTLSEVAGPTVAQAPSIASRPRPPSSQDALTAALLFVGLAALFALTRSHWLDDWDSVNFAFALDDFDVTRHRPHPPGYPLYIAAGKLARFFIADHAAALTLVSALAGAAVASMFYLLDRRHVDWSVALCATLIMALSPLFWLQSGLALTDMFGMVFVLAFLLVEGGSPRTPQGDLARRVACGVIAGLSLGARPHITLLILAYWCVRGTWSRSVEIMHGLTAALSFALGAAAWLIPASLATGGMQTYLHATIGQFEWRFGKPNISVLDAPISVSYLLSRSVKLIGSLGQAFAPMHLTASDVGRRTALGLLVITPYVVFAWRSASKDVARPYIVASAIALEWIERNRPGAILYSGELRRHAAFYRRDGDTRSTPRTDADCDRFRRSLESGRPVLSTRPELCGIGGRNVAAFKRDARIHDKHHRMTVFEFGRSFGHPG